MLLFLDLFEARERFWFLYETVLLRRCVVSGILFRKQEGSVARPRLMVTTATLAGGVLLSSIVPSLLSPMSGNSYS